MPCAAVELPSVLAVLGDVRGLNCLDLACGLGYWSQLLVEKGAAHVVGVDISEAMLSAARETLRRLPGDLGSRAEFQAGDCSAPSQAEGGPFDLVIAGWLLNDAETAEQQLRMWQNVYRNLKPGGRFIAITPNVNLDMERPLDDRYGVTVRKLHDIKDGCRTRITAYTEPQPIEIDTYHLDKQVYEDCAAKAGLQDLQWHGHRLPEDDRKETGYWDVYVERPHIEICSAHKP